MNNDNITLLKPTCPYTSMKSNLKLYLLEYLGIESKVHVINLNKNTKKLVLSDSLVQTVINVFYF